MRDPHLRQTHDGVVVPGSDMVLEYPSPFDPNVQRIRSEVSEHGAGLYVFYARMGERRVPVVAEAYYPDEMRDPMAETIVDGLRAQRFRDGALTIISFPPYVHTQEVGSGLGSLRIAPGGVTGAMITEINEFNRSTQKRFRRTSSEAQRARELHRVREEEEDAAIREIGYYDAYFDAALETRKLMKPRVYT